MPVITFIRKEFYDMVWSESLTSISEKYNITFWSLKELCEEMEVPTPQNGHWSKIKFGKPVQILPFPESKTAKQTVSLWLRTDKGSIEYLSEKSKHKNSRKPKPQPKPQLTIQQKKNIKTHSDPLFKITQEYYSQEDRRNWNYKNRDNVFSISVSTQLLPRALNFVRIFINAITYIGHSVIVEDGKTYAVIFGQKLRIYIIEKSTRVKKIENGWSHTDYQPTGKLCLKYYHLYPVREWLDNTVLLEDKVFETIQSLEIIAENRIQEQKRINKYREEQRLIKEKEENIRERKEKELNDFKNLLNLSKRHNEATNLRNYINTLEQQVVENNTLTPQLKNWIIWAHQKADWYDPLIEAQDPLLKNVDKETLSFNKEQFKKTI